MQPAKPDPLKGACDHEAQCLEMVARDAARMRKAGGRLAEAATYVVTNYDGLHRLSLALAEWNRCIASEGDRDRLFEGVERGLLSDLLKLKAHHQFTRDRIGQEGCQVRRTAAEFCDTIDRVAAALSRHPEQDAGFAEGVEAAANRVEAWNREHPMVPYSRNETCGRLAAAIRALSTPTPPSGA